MGPIQRINNAVSDWKTLLTQFGVQEEHLVQKGSPCPICGGDDRFSWDGKHNGSGYCRSCGHLGGINLIQGVNDWDLKQTIKELLVHLGIEENHETNFQRQKRIYEAETAEYKKSIQLHYLSQSHCYKLTPAEEKLLSNARVVIRAYREKYPNHFRQIGL